MLVHPWDASVGDDEWRDFVATQGFGQLIAPGRDRQVPVVVPTQYVLEGEEVLLHLARPNPVWHAIDENPTVLLAVAGDWAYIPSAWKAIADEDPALGIPTTYYAAAQLTCAATVVDDKDGKLAILRRQLAQFEPDVPHADPEAHLRSLPSIRGLRLAIREVKAKFKYGGNVDIDHRVAVADRLADRDRHDDAAARAHLLRRSPELTRE
ncbi:MAG TPA: FMN-binding negative transcriptional regulator [Mycobacteriales bacterium]|nr:FMN-binding negative transcriptional regulator [Mycobacteriales bacterium]